MAQIPLTRGLFAVVDDSDFASLSQHKWHARPAGRPSGNFYAVRGEWDGRRSVTVYMHRQIVGAVKGEQVDHANANGLDNRRVNLRRCNQSQNNANARFKRGPAGFRGVYLAPSGRYSAGISNGNRVGKKFRALGCFATAEAAALAFDAAAIERYGEFATLNFPLKRIA